MCLERGSNSQPQVQQGFRYADSLYAYELAFYEPRKEIEIFRKKNLIRQVIKQEYKASSN